MADNVAGNSNYEFDAEPYVTSGAGVISTILTNRANRKEAERARAWQEEMWQKQNEYNLPVNQVARLKEAGINPNLAFGSAASAMGTSVPSSPARAVYDYDLSGAVRNYFQSKYERAAVLAQIRERNAASHKVELENKAMETLLDDYIDFKRWAYLAGAARDQWMFKNNEEWYGADLLGKAFKNDLLVAEKRLKDMQTKNVEAAKNRALQELAHLKAKYGFEDSYYSRGLNPYETSTIAGGIRTLNGLIGGNFPGITDMVESDLRSFPQRIKEWWNRRKAQYKVYKSLKNRN